MTRGPPISAKARTHLCVLPFLSPNLLLLYRARACGARVSMILFFTGPVVGARFGVREGSSRDRAGPQEVEREGQPRPNVSAYYYSRRTAARLLGHVLRCTTLSRWALWSLGRLPVSPRCTSKTTSGWGACLAELWNPNDRATVVVLNSIIYNV